MNIPLKPSFCHKSVVSDIEHYPISAHFPEIRYSLSLLRDIPKSHWKYFHWNTRVLRCMEEQVRAAHYPRQLKQHISACCLVHCTHSSVLAWRIPGMGEPGGLPSMGSHRVGHDWSYSAVAVAHCPQQLRSFLCFLSFAQKAFKKQNQAWRRSGNVSKKRILKISKNVWGGLTWGSQGSQRRWDPKPGRGRRRTGFELVTLGRGQKCLWGLEITRLKRFPR